MGVYDDEVMCKRVVSKMVKHAIHNVLTYDKILK